MWEVPTKSSRSVSFCSGKMEQMRKKSGSQMLVFKFSKGICPVCRSSFLQFNHSTPRLYSCLRTSRKRPCTKQILSLPVPIHELSFRESRGRKEYCFRPSDQPTKQDLSETMLHALATPKTGYTKAESRAIQVLHDPDLCARNTLPFCTRNRSPTFILAPRIDPRFRGFHLLPRACARGECSSYLSIVPTTDHAIGRPSSALNRYTQEILNGPA